MLICRKNWDTKGGQRASKQNRWKIKEENLGQNNLSGEWRPRYRQPDCCSSLSPISDCFFKTPVAEDINYPASVNHVICRPRSLHPPSLFLPLRRVETECVPTGVCCTRVAPLPTEQNARPLLSMATPISCLLLAKFIDYCLQNFTRHFDIVSIFLSFLLSSAKHAFHGDKYFIRH